ncbi:MAG: dihydrolipoamide acetyltransferase family protein [Pelolinea sp.]|nr:dihydrolipoamide acetyltransferase family protein [Pelolinea sp.]
MAEELFIPKLGQTVEEVTIINWHVKDGDKVEQGQDVLEVETDKAVFDVEASDDGYIHIGPYSMGDVVPVLTVVAVIGDADDVFKAGLAVGKVEAEISSEKTPTGISSSSTTGIKAPADSSEKVFASPRARKFAAEKHVDLSAVTPTGGKGAWVREDDVTAYLAKDVKASPIAKRMAEEAGLDLRSVTASGPRGEITRADVEKALAAKSAQASISKFPEITSELPQAEVAERLPLKGVRGVIAERMAASSRTTARVTLFMDVDATEFIKLREKLKVEKEAAWGFKPGYNDLLAKACAIALRQFPYMNARLNEDVIERLAQVHIGIAVDAERGLYVPVIRDVDKKNLETIGREFRLRVDEVRSGRITPENLTGGTFTITNLGMYDMDGFTPVINLPEAAILGVGRIAPKAVVVEGEIAVRQMMTLSLAFDHRLVDGAPAAQFLQYLKGLIEAPNEVTLTK